MRPRKRSLTLRGHRTSVSLEDEFWHSFCDIAARLNCSVASLAAEIDAARGDNDRALATAIRVFVLDYWKHHAMNQPTNAIHGKISSSQ
ncbi:MAG: ribbon-helix-helix domain-containing protein [Rhodobacteraceae bacterium]|nr:ribbon-helix-helix domain-containing protein [Paracoccaceae bacterium]